jgi:hypothetical protein
MPNYLTTDKQFGGVISEQTAFLLNIKQLMD